MSQPTNLCTSCVHKDVCAVAIIGRPWGLVVSSCHHNRLSFDKAQLKEATEEYRRNE